MLAHIRNGQIIQNYQSGKGWVTLEDGRKVSPPVAGFADGNDKIVPVVEETNDTSTGAAPTVSATGDWVVEADRVVRVTTISDMPEEKAWVSLREKRDAKLTDTDWRITKEVEQAARDGLGLQIPLVWLDYRQALRDLPANTVDPFNPVWPQEP